MPGGSVGFRIGIAVVVAVGVAGISVAGGRPPSYAITVGAVSGACAALLAGPLLTGARLLRRTSRSRMRVLDVATRLLVGAVAAWVLANIALNPQPATTRFAPSENSGWDPALASLMTLLLLLLVPGWWAVSARISSGSPAVRRRLLLLAVVVVVVVTQFVIAWGMAKLPGFDAGIIIQSSYRHVFPTATDQGALSYYYMALPNNLLFGFGTYVYFLLWSLVGVSSFPLLMTTMIWLNCLVLDVGALLVMAIARRLGGGRLAVFVTPSVLLFVVLSPWLNTPYSDTIGLTVSVLIVWLWLRRAEAWTVRSLVLIGGVGAVGFLIKPTVVAILVAMALIELVRQPPSIRRRSFGALPRIATLACGFLICDVGLLAAVSASGFVSFNPFSNPEALPITNFMVYGAHGSGGYNADDVARNWTMPAGRRFLFNLRSYLQIVWQTGFFGYLLFLGGKALWMLGDGSFFQGREGDGALVYLHHDASAEFVRSVYDIHGAQHVLVASLWQASWTVLLALLALSLLVPTGRKHLQPAIILRVSLALLVLFLLFSEGRSRYLYQFLPLVVLLGGLAVGRAGVVLRRHGRTASAAVASLGLLPEPGRCGSSRSGLQRGAARLLGQVPGRRSRTLEADDAPTSAASMSEVAVETAVDSSGMRRSGSPRQRTLTADRS